ncbi:NUDIX hydrolase [Halalkalibacter hemicellulosilyticus]|uniref:ADP-ribose pyrophosphatase n=1 Tax=Halalkalibacter hemicellulosilyticusJCM 9152 TaxID=1236971 RepID=W4QI26_9BACI|nr:NUDIX hydrolase [Halalkalibacter hemicellulosilyticus]GAE30964.1 ADP-ribose pyrophosphatase [Halalkalibacter hemicellulosilyticusJCM 9152]
MDHLNEKTIKTTEIYKGKIIDLQLEEVELPDGRTSIREVIKHPGAVAVLPIKEDGKLVLVRQYRKALQKSIIEIPAGKLEENEEPKLAAMRELEEETGYKTNSLTFIGSFYTSPGFADELIHLYVTRDLEVGQSQTDEDEFIDVLEIDLQEAEKLIEEQKIHDAKTMYAIQYARLYEKKG